MFVPCFRSWLKYLSSSCLVLPCISVVDSIVDGLARIFFVDDDTDGEDGNSIAALSYSAKARAAPDQNNMPELNQIALWALKNKSDKDTWPIKVKQLFPSHVDSIDRFFQLRSKFVLALLQQLPFHCSSEFASQLVQPHCLLEVAVDVSKLDKNILKKDMWCDVWKKLLRCTITHEVREILTTVGSQIRAITSPSPKQVIANVTDGTPKTGGPPLVIVPEATPGTCEVRPAHMLITMMHKMGYPKVFGRVIDRNWIHHFTTSLELILTKESLASMADTIGIDCVRTCDDTTSECVKIALPSATDIVRAHDAAAADSSSTIQTSKSWTVCKFDGNITTTQPKSGTYFRLGNIDHLDIFLTGDDKFSSEQSTAPWLCLGQQSAKLVKDFCTHTPISTKAAQNCCVRYHKFVAHVDVDSGEVVCDTQYAFIQKLSKMRGLLVSRGPAPPPKKKPKKGDDDDELLASVHALCDATPSRDASQFRKIELKVPELILDVSNLVKQYMASENVPGNEDKQERKFHQELITPMDGVDKVELPVILSATWKANYDSIVDPAGHEAVLKKQQELKDAVQAAKEVAKSEGKPLKNLVKALKEAHKQAQSEELATSADDSLRGIPHAIACLRLQMLGRKVVKEKNTDPLQKIRMHHMLG